MVHKSRWSSLARNEVELPGTPVNIDLAGTIEDAKTMADL